MKTTNLIYWQPTAPAIEKDVMCLTANVQALEEALAPRQASKGDLEERLINGDISALTAFNAETANVGSLSGALASAQTRLKAKQAEHETALQTDFAEAQWDTLAELGAAVLPFEPTTWRHSEAEKEKFAAKKEQRRVFFEKAVLYGCLKPFKVIFGFSERVGLISDVIGIESEKNVGSFQPEASQNPNSRPIIANAAQTLRQAFIEKIRLRGVDVSPLFQKLFKDEEMHQQINEVAQAVQWFNIPVFDASAENPISLEVQSGPGPKLGHVDLWPNYSF